MEMFSMLFYYKILIILMDSYIKILCNLEELPILDSFFKVLKYPENIAKSKLLMDSGVLLMEMDTINIAPMDSGKELSKKISKIITKNLNLLNLLKTLNSELDPLFLKLIILM